MRPWFVFFLLSGFCGLVYETIWIRLSMAQFGVTSASLSIVVSVFMGGLALGSWLVSKAQTRLARLDARGAVRAYAAAELCIALLALPVPLALKAGGSLFTTLLAGKGAFAWYGAALSWQALALLPSCISMGATIPLGMFAIAKTVPGEHRSFSFLYLANVLGAVVGALLPAFVLVELLGFRATLLVATVGNLAAALLAWQHGERAPRAGAAPPAEEPAAGSDQAGPIALALLFCTGFCSMGIEVVWTRQLTPFLGTVIYAFALVLAIYLAATFAGSALYRRRAAKAPSPFDAAVWAGVALAGALALLAADVRHLGGTSLWELHLRIAPAAVLRAIAGIAPFSAALGFLTPQLVDRYSGGRSDRAGVAYAINTLGCILGPLAAGFALLPFLSERRALLLLIAPFAAFALLFLRNAPRRLPLALASGALTALLAFGTRSLEETFPRAQVVRDHTATSIAEGRGLDKRLLVNGIGMTVLTPATKMMAHLPMALLKTPPKRALAICFGMGTTFRSLRTWGIPVTAVELVPGVPKLFGYFHKDAASVLASPDAQVAIDDGRRFLETTQDFFDVIVIDPPPPVNAAASSLLYSKEFYALARASLAPGGILQQWIPGGDTTMIAAFVRALSESFPAVVAYRGHRQGLHLLASMQPIRPGSPEALAARLPPAAAADLVEWGPRQTAAEQFRDTLQGQIDVEGSLKLHSDVAALTDDRPVNEYYLLRHLLHGEE